MDFGEVIFAYTRAQAIEDGVLVDVSDVAKQFGFRYPVAITEALHAELEVAPVGTWGDYTGWLKDLLQMAKFAIGGEGDVRVVSEQQLYYKMILGRDTDFEVQLHCGPGDDAEPVITLLMVGED